MDNTVLSDEERIPWELIDGKVVMMSPRPRVSHIEVAGSIYAIFHAALKGKTCKAYPDGMMVYLDEKNHFIPDAMIVCDRSKIKDTHIEGAPTLVVEVLSPSTQLYDRGPKMRAYAAAGVEEYWIVDTISRHVEVYRQNGGQLEPYRVYTHYTQEEIEENEKAPADFRMREEDMEQTIHVDFCGGFLVSLNDVFEGIN